jgi:lipid-A-disaccharide synthase
MARPKIFLSAGEASGEHYGALLIAALRRREPRAEFVGLGGARMEQLGLRRTVRAEDVAVMGITEVVRHMPRIYAAYRKLKASLRLEKPDVAILIDFPDVNLRLAAELHRLHIPVVYFVSPQLWAWKKRRIRRVERYVTRMLVIFPFEEPFYRSRGVAAEFVGHPLADLERPAVSREAFARENSLDASKSWIGLLPGSRTRELKANLQPMLEAAQLLGPAYEYLLPVAPTLQASEVRAMVDRSLARNPGPKPAARLVSDARAVLYHARASMVASGTATVEAALLGNPFIAVYRVSPLTYAIAKRVVSVPHVAMVNLIAGRRLVPELIQHEFTAANAARCLRPLLEDAHARATMQAGLQAVGTSLRIERPEVRQTAIERTAGIALESIAQSHRLQQPTRPVSIRPVEERPFP